MRAHHECAYIRLTDVCLCGLSPSSIPRTLLSAGIIGLLLGLLCGGPRAGSYEHDDKWDWFRRAWCSPRCLVLPVSYISLIAPPSDGRKCRTGTIPYGTRRARNWRTDDVSALLQTQGPIQKSGLTLRSTVALGPDPHPVALADRATSTPFTAVTTGAEPPTTKAPRRL